MGQLKILLVEDDPTIQKVHKHFLTQLGFQVDLASTGKKALQYTAQHSYFAIILDLGLPDIGGEVVLSIIREREIYAAQHVPVIIVTAHGNIQLESDKSYIKQADACFTKPITRHMFKQILQELQSIDKEGVRS